MQQHQTTQANLLQQQQQRQQLDQKLDNLQLSFQSLAQQLAHVQADSLRMGSALASTQQVQVTMLAQQPGRFGPAFGTPFGSAAAAAPASMGVRASDGTPAHEVLPGDGRGRRARKRRSAEGG